LKQFLQIIKVRRKKEIFKNMIYILLSVTPRKTGYWVLVYLQKDKIINSTWKMVSPLVQPVNGITNKLKNSAYV
jgi:hypothetical protein